jgi:ankyrin repeat protein
MNEMNPRSEDIVKLIQTGADLNVQNSLSHTPLHFATSDPKCLKMVIEAFEGDEKALKAALAKGDKDGWSHCFGLRISQSV